MSNEKNLSIQGLRGIGIIVIMIFHFIYRFQELYCNTRVKFFGISHWGSIGVGLFFIISGYMMAPYKKTTKIKLYKYYYNKLVRLWIPYLICITITFISVSIYKLPGRSVTFGDYLLNIVGINALLNKPYVDGAHWYLTYLIIFIIIFGAIQYYKKSDWFILYIIWVLNNTIFYFVSFNNSNINMIKNLFYKLVGGPYISYIIIGIMVFRFCKNKDKKNSIYVILICLISILLTLGYVASMGAAISIIIFYGAINRKIKLLDNKILVRVGNLSYVLYLIHQNIGYQVELFFMKKYEQFSSIYSIYALIIILLIAIGINSILTQLRSYCIKKYGKVAF